MHRFAIDRNITVLSLLIFANSLTLVGQTDTIYRLPAGTRIVLKLDAELTSRVSALNDTFLATVTKPVLIRDTIVLPVGTVIEGRVAGVSPAAGGGRPGKLSVVFETLRISNQTRHIDGVLTKEIVVPSNPGLSFLSILGGAAAGGVLGAASKTSKGVLIGAGIGAAAGTGIAFLRKGKEARIRKDEEFEIELRKEVLLPVLDY